MNYEKTKDLLEKYNWVLECYSPLNICSLDGEHYAQNFAAELVIEHIQKLDESNDSDEQEDFIDRFKIIGT